MSDAPKNLERIEQGGTHDLDITFLTRSKALGGVPVYPDNYDSGNPGASVSGTVMVYDATASDPDDAANYSAPAGALNPPTASTLLDGASTGRVLARINAPANAKTSIDLLAEDNLRWSIKWNATINGVAVEFFEFFEVIQAGAAEFGDGLFCTPAEVRAASGFTNARDIDDATVEALLRRAQAEFLHDAGTRRHVQVLEQVDRDGFRFKVPRQAGFLFPDAFSDLEDATAYEAQFLDDDDALTVVGIAVKDTRRNEVTLGLPLPAGEVAVLTGWFSHTQEPDAALACEAVIALATHYIDLRAQEPGSIHLAHPTGGRALAAGRDTFHLEEYRRLLRRYLRRDGGQVGAGQGPSKPSGRASVLR